MEAAVRLVLTLKLPLLLLLLSNHLLATLASYWSRFKMLAQTEALSTDYLALKLDEEFK